MQNNHTKIDLLKSFFLSVLPTRTNCFRAFKNLGFLVIGSLVIYPLMEKLPMWGWDWYYFFMNHVPERGLLVSTAYPPLAKHFFLLLQPIYWRTSLYFLFSLELLAIALLTYQGQKKYAPIILAIFNVPVFFLLWWGQIDGLGLVALATGFIPFILIKPQISLWSVFQSRRWLFWTIVFFLISLIFWPHWPFDMINQNLIHPAFFVFHPADYGWLVLGWPLALIGLILLIGAGKDPYRLMAAGCFLSPYFLIYNLVLLMPVMGRLKGYRPFFLWGISWLILLSIAMGGYYRYLIFLFPLSAFWLGLSFNEYLENIKTLWHKMTNPKLVFWGNKKMGDSAE